ncbi:hypothetical protein GCM10023188_42660 [Pontibacter saemangeumensis]|uniref:DUF2892 domain-containing protein n=1 Tax=Pontibacter saemangeumensis TaxID=1084525 RepID=A0ABP8M3K9_9BACT
MERHKNDQESRVRRSSTDEANQEVDQQTLKSIRHYEDADPETIAHRLRELDREWDIERVLEVNASTLALSGLVLGVLKDKRWFLLPGVVTTFLLQHGLQGWCPPLPVLRKFGIRTRREVDEERYALKALRGDFDKDLKGMSAEGVLKVVRAQ